MSPRPTRRRAPRPRRTSRRCSTGCCGCRSRCCFRRAISRAKSLKNMRSHKRRVSGQEHTVDTLIEQGIILCGSPDTVRKQLIDAHRLLGFQNFLCLLQFATLPRDLTEKNIRMFAREVMPALQALTDKEYGGMERRRNKPRAAWTRPKWDGKRVLKQLQFNGEVVVVTGAGTGIGRATAEAVAELGATTVLVGAHARASSTRSRPRSRRAAARPRPSPPMCRRRPTSRELRDFVQGRWGRAKAVINNAGNNFISPITELATEKWRELIAVDLDSVFYMCRAFIPLLLKAEEPVDPQRRLDLRAHRQPAHAGLLRGQGRRRVADAAACGGLWAEGPAGELDLPRADLVAAREGLFRLRQGRSPRGRCRRSCSAASPNATRSAMSRAFLVSDAATLRPRRLDPGRRRPDHQLSAGKPGDRRFSKACGSSSSAP